MNPTKKALLENMPFDKFETCCTSKEGALHAA